MVRTDAPRGFKWVDIDETTDDQINWLTAKCEGVYLAYPVPLDKGCIPFTPVTNAEQTDVIVDRERIWTRTTDEGEDDPSCLWRAEIPYQSVAVGPNRKVAALRCFLIQRLGQRALVPDDL